MGGCMNKRANLYLNGFGMISFILTFLNMWVFLSLSSQFFILKNLTALLGFAFLLFFVSIELFLFMLLNRKTKIFLGIYWIMTIVFMVFLTIRVPYSGFLLLAFSKLLKDSGRILLVDKIYIPKEFNRYCKMFGITIKDFKKKRKTSTITKKNTIKIPKESTAVAIKSNKKAKSMKKATI